jgi:hypothetical protein
VIEGLSPLTLRDEAVLTATLARQIVRDPKLADAAFASGIVHDIGHIVLARDPSKRYGEVWRAAHAAGEPIRIAEERELGTTHGLVGAYLLGVWGLPFVLAETVAFHDIPSSVSEGNLELLAAVHLADGVVGAAFAGRDPLVGGELDAPFLDKVGLLAAVPRWYKKAMAALADGAGAS